MTRPSQTPVAPAGVCSSAGSAAGPAQASSSGAVPSSSSARPSLKRPVRLTSSGSFHAGAPIPSFPSVLESAGRKRKDLSGMRRQSTHRYTTFPTQPPKTPSDAPDSTAILSLGSDDGTDDGWSRYRRRGHGHRHTNSRDSNDATPLPIRQLSLLALLSICEQTALNSIGPYLPTMIASFPEIPDGQVGLYVGLLASSFALAQLVTNFLWGYFSDRVGRKPTMLLGTAMLMCCFAFFGFCKAYWQVLVVHIAMGLLNGNAAVVPTVLGEVTDRSNQSKAFTWLPVMYSLGGITGPALGGLLVGEIDGQSYPFLGPNITSAALLGLAVVVLGIWFEETLEDVDRRRRLSGFGWIHKVSSWFGRGKGKGGSWRGWLGSHQQDEGPGEQGDAGEEQALLHNTDFGIDSQDHARAGEDTKDTQPSDRRSTLRQLLNWTTISILLTYLIFQVANISFNSLYPIFASTSPPTGRALGPGTIGVSMSLAGVVTIFFQVTFFERVKARLGNLGTFRLSLLGLALCMCLIPWVGYKDADGGAGRKWLLAELGVILVLKNFSAVGGLSCVLLLVSTAPTHANKLCGRRFLTQNCRSQTRRHPTRPSAP